MRHGAMRERDHDFPLLTAAISARANQQTKNKQQEIVL